MIARHSENRFDILRLIAAWLVIFSHSYPLSGAPMGDPLTRITSLETLGGLGVITFFALSGYLVTLSVLRTANLPVFIWHRIVRIYPALIVLCVLTVLVLGPLLTALPVREYLRNPLTSHYLWTALGRTVQYQLPGLFENQPLANVVNGSLWSLPVEVDCYIALVAVVLFRGELRHKALILAAGLLVVLLLRPAASPTNTLDPFFMLDYQQTKLGLVFALGSVYGSWGDRIRPRLWVAIALLGLAVMLPQGTAWSTAPFLLGSATLVLWLALKATWLPQVPARMGDWSYGLYLYGFPVQQVLAHFGVHKSGFVSYLVLATFISLVLAALSWHLVEKRALSLRRWVRTRMVPTGAAAL